MTHAGTYLPETRDSVKSTDLSFLLFLASLLLIF